MAQGKRIVIAFDLYGTLLCTKSISELLMVLVYPTEIGRPEARDKAESIAIEARRLQLEYTWRSNSMGEPKGTPSLPVSSSW